ncbi:response regulator [Bacillus sp. HC-Mk]
MMPFVDGYTLCEEIRKYHDIPVILLTAKDQLVDKEKGFISGSNGFTI